MQPRIQPDAPTKSLLCRFNKKVWLALTALIVSIPLFYYLMTLYIFFYVPQEQPLYETTTRHLDDTLRIAFIGDSWADYHTSLRGDTIIDNAAKPIFSHPIKSSTRGKKGAISKEIYYFMYSSKTEEHSYEPDRCTQPLIEDRPDYCVVFAGINDVTFKRPTSFYAQNLRLIIRLLLHNGIRPVVMEIPLVNFTYPIQWQRYYERWFFFIRSIVMGTYWKSGEDYQNALREELTKQHLTVSIRPTTGSSTVTICVSIRPTTGSSTVTIC